MVTIVIPGVVIYLVGSVNVGWSLSPPLNLVPPFLGVLFVCGGLVLLVKTISLFAAIEKGTLAPWDPTHKLVIRGIYRYVRNPMISGVFCILLGEAMLLGSLPVFYWFVFFLLGNLIYMPLVEERALERRFGEDYVVYKQNVPRWIPRLSPWDGPPDEGAHHEDRTKGMD